MSDAFDAARQFAETNNVMLEATFGGEAKDVTGERLWPVNIWPELGLPSWGNIEFCEHIEPGGMAILATATNLGTAVCESCFSKLDYTRSSCPRCTRPLESGFDVNQVAYCGDSPADVTVLLIVETCNRCTKELNSR